MSGTLPPLKLIGLLVGSAALILSASVLSSRCSEPCRGNEPVLDHQDKRARTEALNLWSIGEPKNNAKKRIRARGSRAVRLYLIVEPKLGIW